MDGLDASAFNKLLNDGASFMEARSKASSLAKDIFEQNYLQPLKNVTYQPAYTVQLRGTLLLVYCTGDSLNHLPLRHGQGRY
jgi:hypothetical protein